MITLRVNLDMSVALARMVTPEDLREMTRHAGDDLRDALKNHFIDRSQRVGSRNYWAAAAEATESHMEGRTARVTVSHTGVRLHLLGGTVRPTGRISPVTGRPTKSLLVPGPDSPLRKRRITLAEAGIPEEEIMVLYSTKSHLPYLARVQERKRMYKGQKQKVTPLGLLLKSVTHDPDRTVLPSDQELTDTVKTSAVDTLAQRISERTKR